MKIKRRSLRGRIFQHGRQGSQLCADLHGVPRVRTLSNFLGSCSCETHGFYEGGKALFGHSYIVVRNALEVCDYC